MPLYYHGSFLAVIGITGELDQIRQYVHLADRITHLLIREKELNRLSRSLEDKKHFVIDALIRNEIADPDYLDTCLSDLQVNPGTKKRLLIIQSSPDGHNNSSSLEQKIIGLFGTLGITLYPGAEQLYLPRWFSTDNRTLDTHKNPEATGNGIRRCFCPVLCPYG